MLDACGQAIARLVKEFGSRPIRDNPRYRWSGLLAPFCLSDRVPEHGEEVTGRAGKHKEMPDEMTVSGLVV